MDEFQNVKWRPRPFEGHLMLDYDKGLKEEFERKMESDQQFASSPNAILNWFYERTLYWDEELNVYPIARIERRN